MHDKQAQRSWHFVPSLPRKAFHAAALAAASASLASAAAAQSAAVDPDELQATIISVSSEGVLCPEGSLGIAISTAGSASTVIFSQSVAGEQSAGCQLTFELDVPDGLSLGMPTTILRGVSLGRTRLERRYAFDGAGASSPFIEELPVDFVILDRTGEIQSRSCEGNRRVLYTVDVTAQVIGDSFFQLDSVDLDTTFRTGTDWRFCDPDLKLEVEPGDSGEFCDGPQLRPCAAGLRCDRERDPNSAEGTCVAQ